MSHPPAGSRRAATAARRPDALVEASPAGATPTPSAPKTPPPPTCPTCGSASARSLFPTGASSSSRPCWCSPRRRRPSFRRSSCSASLTDALFPSDGAGGVAAPQLGLLTELVALMIAIFVASAGLSVWQTWVTSNVGNRVTGDLRVTLFDRPAAHGARVLHAHQDRSHPVAPAERRGRRRGRAHHLRVEHRGQHRHRDRVARRDDRARLAPHACSPSS